MKKKKFRWLILLSIIAVIYIIGAVYYNSNVMPNTTMYNQKINDFSNEKIHNVINEKDLTLAVRDEREKIIIPMKEINFEVKNVDNLKQDIIYQQNSFAWPFLLLKTKNYDIANIVVDENEVTNIVEKNNVVIMNESISKSIDAHFKINEETNSVQIVPEVVGNELDSKLVYKTIIDNLSRGHISFNLNRAILLPSIFAANLEDLKKELEFKINNDITINVKGKDQIIKPTLSDKLKWFNVDYQKKELTVDKNAILSYFKNVNKNFNKTEKKSNRVYRVYNGKSTLVKKGTTIKGIDVYEITAKTYAAMVNNKPLNTEIKAVTISKPKVVYQGHTSIDSNFIEISIPNQKLYLYSNGKLVLTASIVTGRAGVTPTPLGNFSIAYKTTNFTMRGAQYGYDYVLDVSYWMPLTNGNGVGLHDAPWRAYSSFGGNIYQYDGSHGCINMRLNDVRYVYNTVSAGTGVWIH